MTSFLAVVFFCVGDCYFYGGKTLHATEAACQKEVAVVVKELEKDKIQAAFQCIKVPLRDA